jgi:hypothetical protein
VSGQTCRVAKRIVSVVIPPPHPCLSLCPSTATTAAAPTPFRYPSVTTISSSHGSHYETIRKLCMPVTHTHTHTQTQHTQHAHAHARAHTHTHACADTSTYRESGPILKHAT